MRKRLAVLAASVLAITALPLGGVSAAANACDTQVNNTYKKLLECVTLDGARGHQAALQAIADANNGIRTSGTPGYDKSVAYAVDVFEQAGLDVTVQEFQFQTFITLTPPVLEQVFPAPGDRSRTRSCPTRAAVTSG